MSEEQAESAPALEARVNYNILHGMTDNAVLVFGAFYALQILSLVLYLANWTSGKHWEDANGLLIICAIAVSGIVFIGASVVILAARMGWIG